MSRRNPFIRVAEAALAEVIEGNQPITPRALHDVLKGELEFVYAQMRVFDVEQGMSALRTRAVDYVLNQYGDAINMGRDAEHVAEHNGETLARRMAMLEQQRAQLDQALAKVRNDYAQMTLESDIERATVQGETV